MKQFIECKVKHNVLSQDGNTKPVTDAYLVSALTFTEAEKRIVEEVSASFNNEFEVNAVKRSNVDEIVAKDFDPGEDYNKWYAVKTDFITIDERTGKEKHSVFNYLVAAPSLNIALTRFDNFMRKSMTDYEVLAISLTQIVDILS